jgi:hypothetical protein
LNSLARARHISLAVASVMLIGLAAIMFLASPALGTLIAAVLPMLVAVWALRGGQVARLAAVVVAAAYGGLIAFIATTPLRQPTPPPGQAPQTVEAAGLLLAVGFFVAAILFVLGARNRER